MRNVDLTPLYRSIVGFDRMAHQIELAARQDAATGWPPYNIEHVADDTYRIELAVAGFGAEDLDIELKDNVLTVIGKKTPAEGDKRYLHRGIAERGFERRFQLADHVHVTGADLVNGLLVVDLVREVPEALKPRKIAIGGAANSGTLIESDAVAAPKADDQAA
jgi:molecular chaperone IbpA